MDWCWFRAFMHSAPVHGLEMVNRRTGRQQVERHADWWAAAAEQPLCADWVSGLSRGEPGSRCRSSSVRPRSGCSQCAASSTGEPSSRRTARFLRVPPLLNGTSLKNTRSPLLDKWLEKLSSKSADGESGFYGQWMCPGTSNPSWSSDPPASWFQLRQVHLFIKIYLGELQSQSNLRCSPLCRGTYKAQTRCFSVRRCQRTPDPL